MVRIVWLHLDQKQAGTDSGNIQLALHNLTYQHITRNVPVYATERSVAVLYDTRLALRQPSALAALFPPCFSYEGAIVSTYKLQSAMQSLDALTESTHCGGCYIVLVDSIGAVVSKMATERSEWFGMTPLDDDGKVLLVATTILPPECLKDSVHFETVGRMPDTPLSNSITTAELMQFGSMCRDMSIFWEQFCLVSDNQ